MSEATPPPTGPSGLPGGDSTSSTTSTPSTPSTPTGSSSLSGGAQTAPTRDGEYFNQSRLKVIGSILALVLLTGALGGIAGVAFDEELPGDDEVIQPGQSAIGAGSMGNSASYKSFSRFAPRLAADSTGSPTPVGSATPDSTESPSDGASPSASASPTASPTESTAPSPTESPTNGGDDSGSAATLAATGVQVYVPPGWELGGQDDYNLGMYDGMGDFAWAYAESGYDTSIDAGQFIAENLEGIFPPENYTQFQAYETQAIGPYGSVVSIAAMHYDTLWVDDQASLSLHGVVYAAVRQDGTILVMTVERTPAEDWDNRSGLDDIINITYNAFGGTG